jgi:hypothetical protein
VAERPLSGDAGRRRKKIDTALSVVVERPHAANDRTFLDNKDPVRMSLADRLRGCAIQPSNPHLLTFFANAGVG